MKKMIRMAMMAAVMFVAVASVSKAQDAAQQGGRRGGGRGAAMLLQGITVDSATTAKVTAIMQKYQPDMMAARQAGDTAKSADLRKKEYDEIKALLTADQQKQFDANVAAMAARGRRGGGR